MKNTEQMENLKTGLGAENDKRDEVKCIVDSLVSLGYAEIDPELKLFHCTTNGDADTLRKLLEDPGWGKKVYNINIPFGEIRERYAKILQAPWALERIAEMKSKRRH